MQRAVPEGKEHRGAPTRRTFLSAATAAAGGFALACVDRTVGVPVLSRATTSLPLDPSSCGIEHVVVMMMENRSFDHFPDGCWMPTDGRPGSPTSIRPAWAIPPMRSLRISRDTVTRIPTIRTQAGASLAAGGLQGRYYYGDVPFLGLWGAKYLPISRRLDEFFADCRRCCG